MLSSYEDVIQRMEAKTIKIKYSMETECWIYQGSLTSRGYGRIRYREEEHQCHIVSFHIFKGFNIESQRLLGLDVCHKCHNRACWNPDHLFLGTKKDKGMDNLISSIIKSL